MNKNKKYLSSISFNENMLNSIIIGLLLGDGSLYRSSLTSNTRFEMSFGQNYKSFAEHLENIFSDYISNPVKSIEIKGKNKNYLNYRLKTISSNYFNKYHEMFYNFDFNSNKFIKIMPKNINNLLDPISLAYLIMSDGNFDKTRKRIRIYTNCYKKEEVIELSNAINNKFNIYIAILHDRKDQWIITIGAKQLDLLRNIVLPYFHDSMKYRLGLN